MNLQPPRFMNLKFSITAFLLLLFGSVSIAQEAYTLQGKVTAESDNTGLPGVNVVVVDGSNVTTSDIDGNYEIMVKPGDVLQFSFIGYFSQKVTIDSQKTLNISLVEDNENLDEVLIVGYGARKKSHNTGAISQIDGKNIASIQANRVDDALAGKLSGVLIQNQSGEPGADPKIQIRASSSVSGDSRPLVVVDGYPISGSLATINSNDIESMEILKDAASAAIYGSRGANGVILVTTKKGEVGKTRFGYNTYVSVSNKYRSNILLSGPEWADHSREQIAAGNWDVSQVDPIFLEYRLRAYENSPGAISPEDWLFQTGVSQNHNFNMMGGTEDAKYYASFGYQNTDGVALTQNFERFNGRINLDANLGDRFKTGFSFNGFSSDRTILAHDMRDLLRAYGVHPVYHTQESIDFVQGLNEEAMELGLSDFDSGYRGGVGPSSIYDLVPGDRVNDWHYGRGNNGIGGSGDAGPAEKLDNAERWQKTTYANLVSYLQFQLTDNLNIRTTLGGDMNNTRDFYYQGLGADSRARPDQTDLDQTNLNVSTILSETVLNYAKIIDDKHDLAAVAGFEVQNTYFNGVSLTGTNVPFSEIINYNLLEPADITSSEREEKRVRNSVFGRVQYAYDNRYLASFSVRRDGDSRFGANNKYATFPAFSLGWNVHNEDFWGSETVSSFKVRASRGTLGTTSFLGSYDAVSLLNPTPTEFGIGFLVADNVTNPDLTWQTNTETNIGVELGFISNRVRLSADYYTSDIKDMLIRNTQSFTTTGNNFRIINGGDMTSSGVDIGLTANVVNNGDLTWDLGANISTVSTEITDLNGLDELPEIQYGQSGRGPIFRNYVGGEIGEMWGLETIGDVEMIYLEDGTRHPNNATGESYVVDQNNDGVINSDDYVKIGQATPDFYWGLNSSMSINSFDFSLQLQGSHGAEVYNIDPLYYESQWSGRLVDSFDVNDDDIADHNGEHYTGNRNQTDYGIQSASYVALRNITFGYTLRPEVTERFGFTNARLYLAATNLFYLMGSDYTSYNPEGVETTNSGYAGPTTYGVQVGASPIVRSFTFGVNVNF